MNVMKVFLAASVNPFDVKAALLAGHAQHPLFIASVVFEVMAAWRKQPVLATLLQSAGSRIDHPVCNRNWSGSLALATGGRGNKRQLTSAYDLCADFPIPDLVSHMDAVAFA